MQFKFKTVPVQPMHLIRRCWPPIVLLLLITFGPGSFLAQSPEKAPKPKSPSTSLADRFYLRGEYDLALIEYMRLHQNASLRSSKDNNASTRPPADLATKIALSYLHRGDIKRSLAWLADRDDFSQQYILLFGLLREGRTQSALNQMRFITAASFTDHQQNLARLLGGTVFLEGLADSREHDQYYLELADRFQDPESRQLSLQVYQSLQDYRQLEFKSELWAGVFSALVPGSGQIYAEHYVDGSVAFFFNTMFLGSAIRLYQLEEQAGEAHQFSLVTGIIGITFYISNILGARNAARRYNIYQQRKFYQDIRTHFFNLDYIERTSQIQFTETF
ncbi:MAG: hypothetical protein KDK39_08285 [Leptospiraceae bacterium]|nr:hypothetical protein [Leptospiraceae bacterium]